MATFVDMFAGAGGFSEGFLQVEEDGRYFDFLLGSDINPTCEVTHEVEKKLRFREWTVLRFWGEDITKHTNDCVKIIEETIEDIICHFI